ncbi:hypothetical protein At15955_52380 (plasmid) [Agrobacterium tumefaciens]|nr:hypothetical protein At15955_52380 [Agrobacterium tumefaciens]
MSRISAHNARLDALAGLVQETGVLRLRDAASRLGVSEITIRRDIAADGQRLSCLGGYIIPVQDGAISSDYVAGAGEGQPCNCQGARLHAGGSSNRTI